MARKNATSNEAKKEFAQALYFNNTPQTEIAEKVGVSRPTISKWINEGGWAERRAAKNISRPELANRLLKSISDLIDKVNNADDGKNTMTPAVVDQLSKMAAAVEKLDKKAGVVETIEVFIAFGKWLEYQRTIDPSLTPELVKTINEYQNKYINDLMAAKLN